MDTKFKLEDFPKFTENSLRFHRDQTIMKEGEPSDGNLYLLYKGSVGIYRTVDETEVFIERIDAINFVGEIEIYTGGARLASVRALTDDVMAFRMSVSDLGNSILPNALGELLAQRLSFDLKDYSNRYLRSEACVNRLLEEKERAGENTILLIIAINKILDSISRSAFLSENEIVYLISLREMIRKFVATQMPETHYRIENANKVDFNPLFEKNIIPEILSGMLISPY
ncbi:MAG: cyclic nucleotide-binding domain-containing protein [Chloroflexi bacterium]|nr:cyclic nucleotide-binding domain-containing protein [Chloroflexota bacterium]BCY17051.1 hypothetical protein hrd7_09000 [Leptolinea sp. HRD-7]